MYVQTRVAKRSVQQKNCSNSIFEPHNTIHEADKTSVEDNIPEDQKAEADLGLLQHPGWSAL